MLKYCIASTLLICAITTVVRAQDPASDDFERATLGNSWRVAFGGSSVGIIDGDVGLVAGDERFGIIERHNSSYDADQFSEGIVATTRPDSMLTQVFVRRRASDLARYGFHWDDRSRNWQIKFDGVPTAETRILASTHGPAPLWNDTLRLEVRGRTLRGLLNGRALLAATDTSSSVIDEAGQPGLAFRFTTSIPASYPATAFAKWSGGALTRSDVRSAAAIVVDSRKPLQRFEGFGATTLSLVYGSNDFLTPSMRAKAIEAVYGYVKLTMGQVEPGLMETPANATDPWNERRNDNGDPFAINPSGFNWTANDAMKAKLIDPARAFGLDNWSLANKFNTSGVLNFLEPLRTSDYQRYLDEAAEFTVAGLIHWRDSFGITPRWVAPWNEPTSGNREIVGATTQTLVDLVKRIGRRMADSGFGNVKFVVPNEETVQRSYDVANAMLEDNEARSYVGAIGYHAYPYESPYSSVRQILEQSGRGRPVASQVEIRRRLAALGAQYNVPVWLTEISEGPGNNDYPFGAFENMRARAIHIHDEILYAGASAYYGMNAMWDRRSHEEHFAGRGVDFFSESSAIALVDLDSVYISGIGYAIGHIARWIKRGATVLDSRSSDSLVQVTAFRDDSLRRLVLVIINNASEVRDVGVRMQGLKLSPDLIGEQSTAQFRWRSMSPFGTVSDDSIAVSLAGESITTIAGLIQDAAAVKYESTLTQSALSVAAYPNPSRGDAIIRYRLAIPGAASLTILNSIGERVWTRPRQHEEAGDHVAIADASHFPVGFYALVVHSEHGHAATVFRVMR